MLPVDGVATATTTRKKVAVQVSTTAQQGTVTRDAVTVVIQDRLRNRHPSPRVKGRHPLPGGVK